MQMHEIHRIIEKTVAKKGYILETHKSASTNSWYYRIHSGDSTLVFRVSDHKGKNNIMTLRADKKNTPQSIENFINSRCEDLSFRRVKELLGIRSNH